MRGGKDLNGITDKCPKCKGLYEHNVNGRLFCPDFGTKCFNKNTKSFDPSNITNVAFKSLDLHKEEQRALRKQRKNEDNQIHHLLPELGKVDYIPTTEGDSPLNDTQSQNQVLEMDVSNELDLMLPTKMETSKDNIIGIKANYKANNGWDFEIDEEIYKMKRLQFLDLNFTQMKLTNRGLITLGASLHDFTDLTALYINVSTLYEFSDHAVMVICYNLRALKKLKKFKLTVRLNLVAKLEPIMVALADSIKETRELTLLKLNFGYCEINNKELEILGAGLKTIRNLSSLSLRFRGSQALSDEGLVNFIDYLSYNVDVTKNGIEQSFTGPQPGIFSCSETRKERRPLSTLKLDFLSMTTTETSMPIALDRIKNVGNLKSLKLGCFDHNFSDMELVRLCRYLDHLSQIQSLNLDFRNCEGLSEAGFTTLYGSLEKISTLKNLKLNFDGCPKVTTNVAMELALHIRHLKKLQFAHIRFPIGVKIW
jgi:uncharacterized Zn finger protein (UPF0148 family)